MPEFLLLVVVALVVAALVFGVAAMVTGADPGLTRAEPDGVSRGLPGHRPLAESDLHAARFDTALRGYRMAQVDAVLARAAYDVGFKQEMIEALTAEVEALRDGRTEDAEVLRKAREAASAPTGRTSQPPDDDSASPQFAGPAAPADTPPAAPVAEAKDHDLAPGDAPDAGAAPADAPAAPEDEAPVAEVGEPAVPPGESAGRPERSGRGE